MDTVRMGAVIVWLIAHSMTIVHTEHTENNRGNANQLNCLRRSSRVWFVCYVVSFGLAFVATPTAITVCDTHTEYTVRPIIERSIRTGSCWARPAVLIAVMT